ncbi:cell division protein FtsL [Roseibium aestuarii]|uniref:Cell division protein FtsL n=1 Tax=Roseibium aestuarii TaxID=2600299 RepID=A0ABW4JWF9_9HYPH|nr:hypothetical protein [Roseibium aestuarii]
MVRYLNVFFILLVVVGAAALYDMKLGAKDSASRVVELQQQIGEEQETIRQLKAEWSLLNQPDRLQGVVDRYNEYLQLAPLDAHQIVSVGDLPARPVMMEPIGGKAPLSGYAGAGAPVIQ